MYVFEIRKTADNGISASYSVTLDFRAAPSCATSESTCSALSSNPEDYDYSGTRTVTADCTLETKGCTFDYSCTDTSYDVSPLCDFLNTSTGVWLLDTADSITYPPGSYDLIIKHNSPIGWINEVNFTIVLTSPSVASPIDLLEGK